MKRNRKNFRLTASRGETLVEMLACIVIAVLSVSLLVSGITVSARINQSAEHSDEFFYRALSAAEERSGIVKRPAEGEKISETQAPGAAISGKVIVTPDTSNIGITFDVKFYGGEGVYSYGMEETEAGTGE